ncbi:hypothetical protein DEM27_32625 [Metarhizobium album]|uniref:Phage head morphogenesis domain-containing protein n=1 Tax=Metarhizobium album TaxID=2182425 RepID=A0A2U2DFP6_9HYPH|nr:phage minor head protein [Rhizobium album]PWE52146.1 hypothetical protein DEM27_32625 [Rhizobium album]
MTIRQQFPQVPEVSEYFDRKALKPGFSWLDVWAEEHAYSFTVAKATEVELLTAFRNSISTAIATGQGFENWKKEIAKDLVKLGWDKPRMVKDPTGEQPDRMVNFGSDRRLKLIFWSNANSARSAGQWERAQRTKKALPYILYVRTTSGDPRPEHLAWVGLILPVDHPFWRSHWPPNGWQCKCQIRQISAREAERLMGTERVIGKTADGKDITIRYSDQVPDLGPDIQHRNRRTGEVTMVPPGLDPGWHTNPGLARASTLVENLEARLAGAAPADATAAVKSLWADPYAKLAPRLLDDVQLPAGVNAQLAAETGARSSVVSVSSKLIADQLASGAVSADDIANLPDLIADGTMAKPQKSGARSIVRKIGRAVMRSLLNLVDGKLRVTSLSKK